MKLVNTMKYFLTGSFITIIILITLFSYRQNIFSTENLPYDDEQSKLNDHITIHFSHVVAENTPKGIAAEHFANLVEEKSSGRIQVKIYPNGILYNDENEVEALKKNEIQMIAPTISKMTDELPNWQILDLPFYIKTNEDIKKVLNGKLSKELLLELDQIKIKGLTFWSNGFKQIASTTPILDLEDFNGKRVRMMPSNLLSKQFKLLGATPVPSSFGDVFYDLQENLVDAQENTISNIYSKQFHTMENYITLSDHGILAYAVLMNEDFWNKLNQADQTIITESLMEMQEWQFNLAEQFNKENLDLLRSNPNVTIYPLDEKYKKMWQKQLQPIYKYYESKGNKQYIEDFQAELDRDH